MDLQPLPERLPPGRGGRLRRAGDDRPGRADRPSGLFAGGSTCGGRRDLPLALAAPHRGAGLPGAPGGRSRWARSSTAPSSTASPPPGTRSPRPTRSTPCGSPCWSSLIAVTADTVFGVGVALILARHRFPGAWLLDALIDIPLAISPVVVGLSLSSSSTGTAAGWATGSRRTASKWSSRCPASSWPRPRSPSPTSSGRSCRCSRRSAPSRNRRRPPSVPVRSPPSGASPSRPSAEGSTYGVVLTTARVLGEFGAVAIVSGAIAGKTQTMTLFIADSVDNLDPVGAYAGSVILAADRFGGSRGPRHRSPGKEEAVAINIRSVSKRFGGAVAVDDVSLTSLPGSLTALLGPSGGGKSTLLRIVAGLETPDTGTVEIDGEDVTAVPVRERGIGFCFQHYAPFRHLTVRRNVGFGLEVRRRPKAEIRQRVDELLDLVRIGHLADRYPSQLSGGQRQRMALARALAIEPRVLLLGRTVRRARRPGAPAAPGLAARAPREDRRDHRPRHPRPGRGDGGRRPAGHHQRRTPRTGRVLLPRSTTTRPTSSCSSSSARPPSSHGLPVRPHDLVLHHEPAGWDPPGHGRAGDPPRLRGPSRPPARRRRGRLGTAQPGQCGRSPSRRRRRRLRVEIGDPVDGPPPPPTRGTDNGASRTMTAGPSRSIVPG